MKKFEIGKYYKNPAARAYLAVRGCVKTMHWGDVFVVEFPEQFKGLRPIPDTENCANNWTEITEEEWLQQTKDE